MIVQTKKSQKLEQVFKTNKELQREHPLRTIKYLFNTLQNYYAELANIHIQTYNFTEDPQFLRMMQESIIASYEQIKTYTKNHITEDVINKIDNLRHDIFGNNSIYSAAQLDPEHDAQSLIKLITGDQITRKHSALAVLKAQQDIGFVRRKIEHVNWQELADTINTKNDYRERTITTNIDPSLLTFTTYANKADLEAVANNLSKNAYEHGKATKLHIAGTEDEKEYIFTFTNNGSEFPRNINIWERGVSTGTGSGIGMDIVKSAVLNSGATKAYNNKHSVIIHIKKEHQETLIKTLPEKMYLHPAANYAN